MKAMLLAAGEGSRLSPLTQNKPKPMLEIGGVPILEHNVRLLVRAGVDHIVINLHHCPDAITEHFGDGSRFGVHITYSHEPVLLGTAGGLKNVESVFESDDFFLVYGDNLTTMDLLRLSSLHRQRAATLTMALFERENPQASGIVEIDAADRIVRFLEKPQADQIFSRWVNAGFLVLSPRVLSFIPPAGPADFGHDVFGALLSGGEPLYGYRMSEPLWWIDSIADYERTRTAALGAFGAPVPS